MNRKCDVLIIGAGILGCFAARNLCRYQLDIMVIEKREDVCCGISRANTGIIYQGYDQHPDSLKAKLCRKASLSFPSLCRELDVHYRKSGLLMVSSGPNADNVLKKKLAQGKANGIHDIKIIDSQRVYELEPRLCEGISCALYSENTYTVNPWELGIAAYENAVSNNAAFFFNEEAINIARTEDGFLVETEKNTYSASRVLCCAGFAADKLWELVSAPTVRILPQAADYLVFDKSVGNMISHVISFEPEQKGEGLTLVPTADGNILAGPTRREVSAAADIPADPVPSAKTPAGKAGFAGTKTMTADSPSCSDLAAPASNSTEAAGLKELKEKCRKLIPALPTDMVIRNFGAARPNPFFLEPDGSISKKSLHDFIILEDNGFFDLIGIKTPGITCANELGSCIASRIISSMPKTVAPNLSYHPERKGIPKVSAMIESNPEQLQGLPPEYFEIVCRCEHISKGEVLEALHRGAVTIDGVKRRTGAGMGRCQGGYCMEKILHIISDYYGTDPYAIKKDGPGSEVLQK